DAVQGVEPQSETVWRQADRYHVPRICFVNKMDRVGASYDDTIESIKDRLGAVPIPMQIPIGSEAAFRGVVDLLTMQAIYWNDDLGKDMVYEDIPADMKDEAIQKRAALVEMASGLDDDLMIQFLDGHEIGLDELKAGLRRLVLASKVTLVYCGSSLRNKGVQPVLDAVVDFLPSPLDIPPVKGMDPDNDEEIELHPNPDEPLSALVFKIVSDPYMGRLAYFRVYSGKVVSGVTAYNSRSRRRERIGRLLRMYADRREDITEVGPGDIGAVLGLKESFTGDTLCDQNHPVILETIQFPEPVISVAIEPKTTADQDKMADALHRLAEEDPTFQVHVDENTGQTIIRGMGELHLDVIVDRMMREFRVQANIGRPRVSYRETITKSVPSTSYRYVKQTGGRGQYGHVVITMEPLERGSGIVFVNKIVGGAIPSEYHGAIDRGLHEAAETGSLAGYPVTDLKITLVDGSYHEVDSNEMAFKMAAIFAFREAIQRGGPVLLEPIMKVELVMPADFMGDVLGQISARRAEVLGIEIRPGNAQAVRALVPLAEMFGYATELRSATQGRGVFSMEYAHYAPVPVQVAEKILNS
ncbi:MAG TPA: elongation factor G, partial [Anaerolineaceae bacterium]|nr:elongation factor G [Anaerolineaceae bacterium]